MKKVALAIIIFFAASTVLAAAPAFPSTLGETPTGSVAIVKGSNINLVSRQSNFPVTVSNTLPGEVRVIVHLRSNSPKVILENSSVQLVIPAGTTMNAKFPIRAIGSGDVVMEAWLTALSGKKLGGKVPIILTANPDIETAAIVLFLSFVVVLIVIGIFRTARRRKTS